MKSSALDDWDIKPVPTTVTHLPETVIDTTISLDDCLRAGKDGVDITNEQYHTMKGISGSNLALLAESNKHLDNKNLFDLGDSDALTFGTLVHTSVLEHHNLASEFVISEHFNLRTNQGKADKAAFEEANTDKIIVTKDSFDKAQDMARNVIAICGDIINNGIKERSYFVKDDELLLKIRPDCYCQKTGQEWDLKTITPKHCDMSDHALERHILNMGYNISAGYRNYVRKLLGMPTGQFNLIFVATTPGHMVRNIRMADAWIEESEWYVKEMLANRKWYLGTGIDKGVSVIDRSSRKYD